MLNVGRRSVQRAAVVRNKGTPKLVAAVERGEIPVSVAAKAAVLPPEQQDEIASDPDYREAYRRGSCGGQSTGNF
jgi:hypothetical protein